MPSVDLEISSVISENFVGSSAGRMASDDGAQATAIASQVAVLGLDDLPSNADTITSVTIHIEAHISPSKTIANIDLKLLNSSGTMLREYDRNIDNPPGSTTVWTSDTWTDYISGGATPSWNTSVVNDMRLQVKHAGNVSGTPSILADYAYVRVVYTVAATPIPTYDTTVNNTHITSGNINVTGGNIFI